MKHTTVYKNLEAVINVSSTYLADRTEIVHLDLKMYPIGLSKNEANAIIRKDLDVSGNAHLNDFTEQNTLEKTAHYMFHDSIKNVAGWIDEWNRDDHKQEILDFFISKVTLD